MTRYKLTIAYDGTKFHGFQRQKKLRTVQGVLEKALFKMTKGQQVNVFGSGRTDAGVHALGQVIHFDYPGQIPADNMLKAINSLMPLDVLVKKSEIVDENFHARYGVKKKTYMYKVDCGYYTDPFKRFYTGHYPHHLSVDKIQVALKDLIGEHDFSSFAASGGVIENKVRTIYSATAVYNENNNELVFEFTGNGFLYNMVRILVATLLEIGNGRRDVHDFLRLFEVKDRQEARGTAPASGLYLKEVFYQ
ncbi:tRNA pseudouridine(38-40) synthase TruA [Companilactobacillus halodurans]|uniref:tRNA pseudouridine synthase A n=1 Tax=Companilactobacillus halodurans TaxID=2584183 RepID=A0A5P0ZUM5_9LACO|nr:tRNA pseudouridine(38-40) synthase TruA [Companilactobacillus halodurans]MQS76862.1 tRNA pseudouridine(38-40) synthase TruA [Companilactobacillus halodurans]MQS96763.1 tRNA pseudouridine(38-40) synthase TruA [Companilactobacillus halodurans]